MTDQPESTLSSTKKRRVIHWDPDHGNTTGRSRWTPLRIIGWTVGGIVGLLVVAGVVIRGIKLVLGPDVFQSASARIAAPADPGNVFVSESKAELAHETAGKALAELRKLPQDHPSLLQRLIVIETAFRGGEDLLASHEYAKAYAHFEELNREIDRFGQDVKLKDETQKAYDDILLRIKDLDRARTLAPEEFDKAFADAGTGRQLLIQGNFSGAKHQFDNAYAALGRAEKALNDYVDGNIVKGQQAVASGERDLALASFRAALEKDPGNEMALQGVKRAEVADRVHALLRQGGKFEDDKEFSQAGDAYAKAFELDPFSAAAQQGKARAARLEKETAFNAAIADAVAARDHRDWPKAIADYERALKVYPQKEDVKKALAEVRDTAHREAVKASLAKAYEYENKYEWEQARSAYYETLQLDKDHAEAKEGYVRTGRTIRTLLEYDKLIEISEEQTKKAEFPNAIRTFNEAMSVKPAYLPLSERVEQLRTVLLAQSQPVDVTFQSDGDTWVSISNFRMLGKIRSETLKMMPGNYEIVGRRKGFQDVLLALEVRNGTNPPLVNVSCTLRTNR